MKRTIDLLADEIKPRLSQYFPELKGHPNLTFRIMGNSFLSLRWNASFPPKGLYARQTFKVVLEDARIGQVERTLFAKVYLDDGAAVDEFRRH